VISMQKEFEIPEGVDVRIEGKTIEVSGEKGSLKRKFNHFYNIKVEKKDNRLMISSDNDRRKVKAMVGTIAAHARNMVKGVTKGYTYKMKIVYSHFPITVKVEGNKILVGNFIGEKIPRVARIIGDAKVEVKGQDIIITGLNKEDVGQTMSSIEQICRITKFDSRIFHDGVYFTGEDDG